MPYADRSSINADRIMEQYPLKRWLYDLKGLCAGRTPEVPTAEIADHSIEDHYEECLLGAVSFLLQNDSHPALADFVVKGKECSIVRDELFEALYFVLLFWPPNMPKHLQTVEFVADRAQKQLKRADALR